MARLPFSAPFREDGMLAAALQRLGDARRNGGARLPPGPPEPALVQAFRWLYAPADFMDRARARYGRVFTVRLAGLPPLVQLADPEAIRELFTGPPELLHAGEANSVLRPVLGAGSLLLLDGDAHVRHRRLLLPPLHGQRMHAYAELIREISERKIAGWPRGRPFPVMEGARAIALDVVLRAVFGLGEGDDLTRLREDMSELVALAMTSPLFLFPEAQIELGPLTAWSRIVGKLRSIDDRLFALIDQRRREAMAAARPAREDVLSLMIDARDEDGQPMSNQELRDELMTMLVAGHDTVSTGLAWTLHHLTGDGAALERAVREVGERRGGDGGGDGNPQDLPWLDAIVKEALRLTPVLPVVGRRLETDMRLGGVDLPAGVRASPNAYLVHRDPDLWPHPTRFDPARFLDARPSPYVYFPFGGGARRCVGMAFALSEMRIVLETMLRRLEIERAPGVTVRPVRHGVSLAPSGGMPIIVRDRR
jgi:cytochrome P450